MTANGSIEPVAVVTGFEPFGKHSLNPSSLIAQRLEGAMIEGHRVRGIELPVTTGGAPRVLIEAVERYRPDLVLAVGLAGGRNAMALERVAINVLDFSIPDNGGDQPFDRPIAADGPAAYFSSLPLKAILAAWREAGIPGYVSNTAGTYLCNQVFYEAAHLAGRHGFRTGFIHVPCIPEQVAGMDPPHTQHGAGADGPRHRDGATGVDHRPSGHLFTGRCGVLRTAVRCGSCAHLDISCSPAIICLLPTSRLRGTMPPNHL